MTQEEKRLKVLNRLLIVKILRNEDKKYSSRVYFKFRKWHPVILFLFVYKVLCYGFEQAYDFAKNLKDELDEEDFIETIKD